MKMNRRVKENVKEKVVLRSQVRCKGLKLLGLLEMEKREEKEDTTKGELSSTTTTETWTTKGSL